jgi:PIN domain nuclease of toxin-antitoxin system
METLIHLDTHVVAWLFMGTRDPFDRLIVANALVENLPLLTFDENIRAHCSLAFWR